MKKETKEFLLTVGGVFVVLLVIFVVIYGPAGLYRSISGWKASAYGSDWLVVQYAQDGSVIAHWELVNKSVGNETNSDGIYFVDDGGNVVHLSGHYIYVQVGSGMMAEVRKTFLKEKQ